LQHTQEGLIMHLMPRRQGENQQTCHVRMVHTAIKKPYDGC
jgi:hypothetical protein